MNKKDFLKQKARGMRSNPTPFEKKFWAYLRKMPFYDELVFNRQKVIGEYIVDFYCHSQNLVIEIDGDTHGVDKHRAADIERNRYLASRGLTVLRFTNRDVLHNIEGVMTRLEEAIDP